MDCNTTPARTRRMCGLACAVPKRLPNEVRITDNPEWRKHIALACASADFAPEHVREIWRYVERHHRLHPIDLEQLTLRAHEDALAKLPSLAIIRAPRHEPSQS